MRDDSSNFHKLRIVSDISAARQKKVPGSEAALTALSDAVRLHDERNNSLMTAQERLDFLGEELRCRSRAFKHQYFEIGHLLCDARKMLPHGDFLPWVRKHFEHSYRTAANCMRVYQTCLGQPELVEYFNPSCLYMVCAPGFPGDLRAALFENAKGPVDVSKKELFEVAQKYRNGEIDIGDSVVQQMLHRQQKLDLKKRCCVELRVLDSSISDRLPKIIAAGRHHAGQSLLNDSRTDNEWDSWLDGIHSMITAFQADLHRTIEDLEK